MHHKQEMIADYMWHCLAEGFGSSKDVPLRHRYWGKQQQASISSRAITSTAQGRAITIKFYHSHNPYYEFTNFYKGKPIVIDGISWKTTEHYFQAQKFVYNPQACRKKHQVVRVN